jgi:hypothetical protein
MRLLYIIEAFPRRENGTVGDKSRLTETALYVTGRDCVRRYFTSSICRVEFLYTHAIVLGDWRVAEVKTIINNHAYIVMK